VSVAAARDADADADADAGSAPARPRPFPLPADLPPPVHREVEALLHVPEHPNVVRLRDVYLGGGGGWGSSAGGGDGSGGPASPPAARSSPSGRTDGAAAAAAAAPSPCRGAAHLVLDYCDGRDLGKLLDACEGPLPNAVAKALARQALLALAHCHRGGGGGSGGGSGGGNSNGNGGGVAHRDVKPGNLLLCARTGLLKLADFGQACVLAGPRKGGKRGRRRSGSDAGIDDGGESGGDGGGDRDDGDDEQQDAPEGALATRWYRPPEVLYGARRYAARAADVWAAGAVLAELYGLQPLLPGRGDLGQLACTVRALGPVDLAAWPEAARLPDWDKVTFAPCRAQGVGALAPAMPERAAALASRMLAWAPERRTTAAAALLDPFFCEGEAPAPGATVAAFARETLARHGARMGRLRLLPVMVAAPLTGARQGAGAGRGAGATTLALPPGGTSSEDETEEGG